MRDIVLVEVADGVATVTLNRPERLNAIGSEMSEALDEAVDALAADDAVRALVLTGAGRGFCAGGDVGGLAGRGEGGGTGRDLDSLLRLTQRLRAMPKVSIAAVNGPCAGAGVSFACACDIRYAAQSAVFAGAYLRVGVPGDYGSCWLLTRVVGPAKARELMLLGERIDAAEALRIGLVNEVVPDGEVLAHSLAVARKAATAPPLALAALKANLDDATELGFSEYLDHEIERFHDRMGSEEMRAAAQAFLERR